MGCRLCGSPLQFAEKYLRDVIIFNTFLCILLVKFNIIQFLLIFILEICTELCYIV